MRSKVQVKTEAERLLSDIEFYRALDPQLYVPFGREIHFPELDEDYNAAQANFEFGVLVGQRKALRWVLSGRRDTADLDLLSRDLENLLKAGMS